MAAYRVTGEAASAPLPEISNRVNSMRPEIEALLDSAKQSIGLLRRHL
jgi:hypothetical protein